MKSGTTTPSVSPLLHVPAIQIDKPPDIIYFNNSGKTALPRSVQRAGELAVQRESQPWTTAVSHTEKIRSNFAQIIHASSEDIAIVPSTGFAMTMIAHNILRELQVKVQCQSKSLTFSSKKKVKVLLLQDEMSSEVYAWQELTQEAEIEFIIVPHPTSSQGWTPLILQILQEHDYNVGICCLPQVHWSDGSYIDLALIGKICHLHDIKFVIDGTQSVGIMPLNVQTIQCDAMACSVHKWLLGPHGMSLVYIHSKYHETWLPLDQHEGSRAVFTNEVYDAQENNIAIGGYPTEFVKGARRCDSGGKKNPILEPMICEALRIVSSFDLNASQSFMKRITDRILEKGQRLGLGVQPGPRCGHIIGLRPISEEMVAYLTPETMVEVANRLKDKNIFLAVRCGAFRIAPYLNSTSEDVDRLMEAMEEECQPPTRHHP
jgi:selenocysteine lyase/cysteine desulfurase